LLLTLQLGPINAAAIYRHEPGGREMCGQRQASHGQQDPSRQENPVFFHTQPHASAQVGCGAAAWCLSGVLLSGKKSTVFRSSADAGDGLPLGPVALLKSIHGSPPVPPPIR
jgi:hypothetical protein